METQFKGQIAGFPTEVVEKMLTRQEEQGNKRDITKFEIYKCVDDFNGGFNWDKTIEGEDFWISVIREKNFDKFFKKYPKAPEPYWFGGDYDRGEEPKWHDLRINPEDLPPKATEFSWNSNEVLICLYDKAHDIKVIRSAYYDYQLEKWFICVYDMPIKKGVIAWRNMPKFMEE